MAISSRLETISSLHILNVVFDFDCLEVYFFVVEAKNQDDNLRVVVFSHVHRNQIKLAHFVVQHA